MSTYKPGRPEKYFPTTGKGNVPPELPGEYRLRDESGVIQYIGETSNLKRRINQHLNTGKLAKNWSFEYKVADGRSTSRTGREHEQEKIDQHNPLLNKSRGGEGRPAGK